LDGFDRSEGNQPVLSRYSAGFLRDCSTIEVQHPAESLMPLHPWPLHRHCGSGLEQPVLDTLVIALHVIVSNELANSTAQRGLPDEDHPIQAFLFDGAHEALRIGIQIG
jgi:hypothetical protein